MIDMTKIDIGVIKTTLKLAAPARAWALMYKAMKAYLLLDPANDLITFSNLLVELDLDITVKAAKVEVRACDAIVSLQDASEKSYVAMLAVDTELAPYMLEEEDNFYADSVKENFSRLQDCGVLVGRGWKPCYCGSTDHIPNLLCPEKRKFKVKPPCRNCGAEGHDTFACPRPSQSACPACQ